MIIRPAIDAAFCSAVRVSLDQQLIIPGHRLLDLLESKQLWRFVLGLNAGFHVGSTIRTSGVDDHGQPSLPFIPCVGINDQPADEMCHIRHVRTVRTGEAAHEPLMKHVLRHVAFKKRVGADRHPLNERVGSPDAVAEEVGGVLVVPGGWHCFRGAGPIASIMTENANSGAARHNADVRVAEGNS